MSSTKDALSNFMDLFDQKRDRLSALFEGLKQFSEGKALFKVSVLGEKMSRAQVADEIMGLLGTMRVYAARASEEQTELLKKLIRAQTSEQGSSDALAWLKADLQKSRNEEGMLRRRLTEVQNELAGNRTARRDCEGRLQSAQAEIESLKNEIERLKNNIKGKDGELRSVQQQAEETRRDLVQSGQWLQDQEAESERQIGELKEQLRRLQPGVYDENIAVSYYEYSNRFHAAATVERVNDALAQWKITVNRNRIGTLSYSFNPSTVASSLALLNAVMQTAKMRREAGEAMKREERVLNADIFYGFAGVLGYSNLYTYLTYFLREKPDQKESRFLRDLCDLSVSSSHLRGQAVGLDAASWLADPKHMPPQGDASMSDCGFTFVPLKKPGYSYHGSYEEAVKYGSADMYYEAYKDHREDIARAIIEIEKKNLLDFRESLSIVVTAIAPFTPEEPSLIEEQEQQVVELPSQLPVGPKVQVKHWGGEGDHLYVFRLTDPANGLRVPVERTLWIDSDGNENDEASMPIMPAFTWEKD